MDKASDMEVARKDLHDLVLELVELKNVDARSVGVALIVTAIDVCAALEDTHMPSDLATMLLSPAAQNRIAALIALKRKAVPTYARSTSPH